MKITIEEIEKIRKEKKKELELRANDDFKGKQKDILVCHGTGCTSSKSPLILKKLNELIKKNNLDNVRSVMVGCLGLCSKGPVVIVRPENTFYSKVTVDDCEEIINSHIIGGKTVERLLVKDVSGKVVNSLDELPFYKKQKRVALKNCGKINPEDIGEYIAMDGFKALEKALTKMTPDGVINEIIMSGLRGRGGAGFK